MSDTSNVSLKFGGGYEAPWFTVYGTPGEIKDQLVEATHLDPEYAKDLSLAQVIIEASRWARGLYTAAEQLTEPPKAASSAPSSDSSLSDPGTKARGLAAQAKARSSEPADNTTDVASLIANAMSTDELNEIYEKHDGKNWPPELMTAAKNRAEELANG